MKPVCLIPLRNLVGLTTALLALDTAALQVRVAWDPNPEPDVSRYKIYYRDTLAQQATTVSVTNNTSAIISGLVEGHTYIFYLTALTTAGLESDPSDSISYQAELPTTDSDGDGLTDAYERAVGLDPLNASDAGGDLDGDGYTNLEEFQAGTDPTDAQSALLIDSISGLGADVIIQFSSVPGVHYLVEGTSDPEEGKSWTTVANVTATDATVSVTDPGANLLPDRFYRVVLAP